MSKHASEIHIRIPRRSEVKIIYKISFNEGWIDTLSQLEVGYDLNPGGWRVAQNEEDEIIGVCAATIINDTIAMMGPYIVKPSYRGRGIGTRLWKEAQASLGSRNIHLMATIPDVYKKIGFKQYPFDFKIMSGIPHVGNLCKIANGGIKITHAGDVPIEQIIEYDTSIHCGIPRPTFLKEWILREDAKALIACQENESGIQVAGLGALRPCNGGWQLAPLYAETPTIAKALLVNLLRELPEGANVWFFILTGNPLSMDLARDIGLTLYDHQKAMYLKEEIKLPLDRIFALSTGGYGLA